MLQHYEKLKSECTPEQIRKLVHVENRRKQYWLWVLNTIIRYEPCSGLNLLLNVEVEDIPDCEIDYMEIRGRLIPALVNGVKCDKTWDQIVLEFEVEFSQDRVRRWCLGRSQNPSPPKQFAGRLALYNYHYVLPLPELNDRQKVTVNDIRRLLPDLMFSGFHVMCMSEY